MSRLVLTADQIYALAYILDAKYLDYYYISLANRGNDNKLWLSEITKQLVSQAVLVEDFSGDTSIDPEIEEIVKPLYFSDKESSLDINIFGDNEENIGYRFHFLDDKMTMTKLVEDGFEIIDASPDDIQKIVSAILPANYSAESEKANVKFDAEKVSRVFIVKNIEGNAKSTIATFVETEGVVYEEDTDDIVYSVSGEDFKDKLCKILTEA